MVSGNDTVLGLRCAGLRTNGSGRKKLQRSARLRLVTGHCPADARQLFIGTQGRPVVANRNVLLYQVQT